MATHIGPKLPDKSFFSGDRSIGEILMGVSHGKANKRKYTKTGAYRPKRARTRPSKKSRGRKSGSTRRAVPRRTKRSKSGRSYSTTKRGMRVMRVSKRAARSKHRRASGKSRARRGGKKGRSTTVRTKKGRVYKKIVTSKGTRYKSAGGGKSRRGKRGRRR